MQLGFAGLIWYFGVICYDLFAKKVKNAFAVRNLLLIALCLLIILLYNDSVRFFNFCVMLFLLPLLLQYGSKDIVQKESSDSEVI